MRDTALRVGMEAPETINRRGVPLVRKVVREMVCTIPDANPAGFSRLVEVDNLIIHQGYLVFNSAVSITFRSLLVKDFLTNN